MTAQSCTVTAVSTGHFHHPCQPSPSRKKRGRRQPAFGKRAVCLLSVRCCAWPLKWPPLRLARFPQPLFKGRSGCEMSGLCSCYCQVVLGAVTTALRNRPSVMDLRVYSIPGFPVHHQHPFPSSRDLPDRGIETLSPALQAYSLPSEPPGKPKSFLSWLPSCAIINSIGKNLTSFALKIMHCSTAIYPCSV